MHRLLLPAFAAACAVFCSAATAGPVSWQLTGVITEGNLSGFFFPFAVAPGDPIAIDLSFDPGTPCSSCSSTRNIYQNPLTAVSFAAKGATLAIPLTSSGLILDKNQPASPGFNYFFTGLSFFFNGFDSSSETSYQGDLTLQGAASMPPVPGINDVRLANLLPPDPAAFVSPFPQIDTNFFHVVALQGRGHNSFSGRTLTISARAVPEFDAASAGAALTLLLGGLAVLYGGQRQRRQPL